MSPVCGIFLFEFPVIKKMVYYFYLMYFKIWRSFIFLGSVFLYLSLFHRINSFIFNNFKIFVAFVIKTDVGEYGRCEYGQKTFGYRPMPSTGA